MQPSGDVDFESFFGTIGDLSGFLFLLDYAYRGYRSVSVFIKYALISHIEHYDYAVLCSTNECPFV
jgi:hypothetical protein